MELANFTVGGQNIDLEWDADGYADLHNCYDFVRLEYRLRPQLELVLEWAKLPGAQTFGESHNTLRLLFEGVTFLKIKERDPEYPFAEDEILALISRTPVDDREAFSHIYFNADIQPDCDLTMEFQNGWGIKVNAATVRLELDS